MASRARTGTCGAVEVADGGGDHKVRAKAEPAKQAGSNPGNGSTDGG